MPPHSKAPPPGASSVGRRLTSSQQAAAATAKTTIESILHLPTELQVNFLTYLRAYDLAAVHQTCRFYHNPTLVHAIVTHTATRVYPAKLTAGFDDQPTLSDSTSSSEDEKLYTFEHLHNMELLVVARVLSQPEPAEGYIVSKSWCKQALRWLEMRQHERQEQHQQRVKSSSSSNNNKQKHHKLSKKKQRLRSRKLSDASPPWPNVNSDLLCQHNSLQLSVTGKATRARRKVLDKQAWKILKTLYPYSTPLSHECMICAAEAFGARKTWHDEQERLRLQRKEPLADPAVRRFYTRTKGVPQQALRANASVTTSNQGEASLENSEEEDCKLPAVSSSSSTCPLVPGRYYILPRAWCYGWRRYIRTGDGGNNMCSTASSSSYPPPDAASLLCDSHNMVLLPPHLEAYLYGEQAQLLSSTNDNTTTVVPPAAAPPVAAASPQRAASNPSPESIQALLAAGLSPLEVQRQLSAMRSMEQQQQQQPPPADIMVHPSNNNATTNNERLDRENHAVVEIVTQAEFTALAGLWHSNLCFGVSFTVSDCDTVVVDMPVCRSCDATGRDVSCRVRNRSVKKKNTAAALDSNASVKQAAVPRVEY